MKKIAIISLFCIEPVYASETVTLTLEECLEETSINHEPSHIGPDGQIHIQGQKGTRQYTRCDFGESDEPSGTFPCNTLMEQDDEQNNQKELDDSFSQGQLGYVEHTRGSFGNAAELYMPNQNGCPFYKQSDDQTEAEQLQAQAPETPEAPEAAEAPEAPTNSYPNPNTRKKANWFSSLKRCFRP